MSNDLDLATLDHWFGWMRNSESWRREREIVYGMWAEIERLRGALEAVSTVEGSITESAAKKDAEIERLRGLLRDVLIAFAGFLGEALTRRVHEALGE